MFKTRISFSKKGILRFISHLDLVRLLYRVLRRSRLPIVFTKGFNPKPKMSFGNALKLGLESDCEEAFFYLEEKLGLYEIKNILNDNLPAGVRVEEVAFQ